MTSTQQERQAFLDWITQEIPAIESYFGLNHLKQWVIDGLSTIYNQYFQEWQKNPINTKGAFIARLTGINPNYASFMAKELNSGNELRGEIAIIQNEADQTQKQIDMYTAILKTTQNPDMIAFASSLLNSYTMQKTQVDSTLTMYQNKLRAGIDNGALA